MERADEWPVIRIVGRDQREAWRGRRDVFLCDGRSDIPYNEKQKQKQETK